MQVGVWWKQRRFCGEQVKESSSEWRVVQRCSGIGRAKGLGKKICSDWTNRAQLPVSSKGEAEVKTGVNGGGQIIWPECSVPCPFPSCRKAGRQSGLERSSGEKGFGLVGGLNLEFIRRRQNPGENRYEERYRSILLRTLESMNISNGNYRVHICGD